MLAVLSVVFAAVLGIFGGVTRQWGGQVSRANAVQEANLGLMLMGREASGAMAYQPLDSAGYASVFTFPADKDAQGNAVPARSGAGLAFQSGAKVRFYLSDATGSPTASGSILWRATAPAGSNVWTPDSSWSLAPGNSTRGRVENASSLSVSQANVPNNVVRIILAVTVKEGAQISTETLRRDVYLSNSNPPGDGLGLNADYFADRNAISGTPTLSRTDASVGFDWGAGSPDPAIPADNFFARWTGQVLAPVSGTYTFYTSSDEGVRLWVNGNLVINNWTSHTASIDASAGITLAAGQKYDIKMEYYEGAGNASARLLWAYPAQPQQVIPQNQLFPGSGSGLPPAPTGLTATASGLQAALAWTAATGATGYNVYRSGSASGLYNLLAAGVGGTSFTDTTCAAGATYFYAVSALNSVGEGTNSGQAWVTFPPSAPTALTAAGGIGQIALAWTASPGAASYSVFRAASSGGEGATPYQSGITGTTLRDASVTAGTSYFYVVRAVNAGGQSAASSEAAAAATLSATYVLSPNATYLHTSGDPGAQNSLVIDLTSLAIAPGDTIVLQQLGAYKNASASPDTATQTVGVFSSSATLLAASNLSRVSGALSAGSPFVTPNTGVNNEPTDIGQDFQVSSTTVVVPVGARYLFLAASDAFYGDNSDPNGDYAVRISR